MIKIYLLTIAILIIISCSNQVKDLQEDSTVIVVVENDVLTENELLAIFQTDCIETISTSERNDVINQWIDLTLLSIKADRLNIGNSQQVIQQINNASKKIKTNALLGYMINQIEISDDDLFNYYKINSGKYRKEIKEYRLQRILITDEEKHRRVVEEIVNGLNFSEAAELYSEETEASNQGIIGFVSEDDVHPLIWERLENLRRFYFATVQLDESYYLVRHINDRVRNVEKSFNEVKAEIERIILEDRSEEMYDRIISELRRNSNIQILN